VARTKHLAGNRAAQRKTCDQPSYRVEVNLNN